jgi:hypothetical protein
MNYLTLREKMSLATIALMGMLAVPSTVCAGTNALGEDVPKQGSLPSVSEDDVGSNTPATTGSQVAVGRNLESGEVPALAGGEQGTATLVPLVGKATTGPAGPLLFAVAPSGIVTLNLSTGAINYCVAFSNLSSGTPIGKCQKLGAISPTGLSGNARLDATNGHAFVTNTATGLITECYLGFYTNNGAPFGSCIAQQLQP